MTNVISATELKNKISEVLNSVYFHGNVTVVERYGKPIAKVIPVERNKLTSREDIRKVLDATFGALPDFPDVTKFRRSRKKKLTLDL